jgi:hypothetical protein
MRLTFGIRFIVPSHAGPTLLHAPPKERLWCHGPQHQADVRRIVEADPCRDQGWVHGARGNLHQALRRGGCGTTITNLEETATTLDKSFTEWRPEVDSSITSIKLELTKLNNFFDRDAQAASSTHPVVLPIRSASARASVGANADGPSGHHIDTSHRDGGFGRVLNLTCIPVMGRCYRSFLRHFPLLSQILFMLVRVVWSFR